MLFHLHIPKTGGTTLFSALSKAVFPGRWYLATSQEDLAERTKGCALVGGHLTWKTMELFPPRTRVLTVIRDPVDHALSLYGYWRARAGERVFDAGTQLFADEAAARSVEELVLDPQSRFPTALGMMTTYLAGAGTNEARAGVAWEETLATALRNLDACAWVGTTDTLDRDMRTLTELLEWPPFRNPARQTVNPDRPGVSDLSSAARKALEDLTAADRKLYERARVIADDLHRRHTA